MKISNKLQNIITVIIQGTSLASCDFINKTTNQQQIMRKITFVLTGCLISIMSYSQVPFVTYEAVPSNGQQNTYRQQQPQPQLQYQITAGYYYDSFAKDFKRIKIKINSTSTYGQPQVYLRGVYNAQYNMWSEYNSQAYKVNIQIDGETIANNFEWKVQAANIGNIYFNN